MVHDWHAKGFQGVSNQAKSPTRFRNLPFLLKISTEISRFQQRFQDFRIFIGFQDFKRDFTRFHANSFTDLHILLKSFLHV